MGIQRTFKKAEEAAVIIYLFDVSAQGDAHKTYKKEVEQLKKRFPEKMLIAAGNKADLIPKDHAALPDAEGMDFILLSAKSGYNLDKLKNILMRQVKSDALSQGNVIVSSVRHPEALTRATEAIRQVRQGLQDGLTGELLAIDIRQALEQIGLITGIVTNDNVLGAIFSRFCIGK
jgi:tRNA modification GTPase